MRGETTKRPARTRTRSRSQGQPPPLTRDMTMPMKSMERGVVMAPRALHESMIGCGRSDPGEDHGHGRQKGHQRRGEDAPEPLDRDEGGSGLPERIAPSLAMP